MDSDDQVPIFILHVLEADVSEDARIVDQHINSAEVLDSRFNDTLAVDHIIVVCHGLSPSGSNLVDNDISSLDKWGGILALRTAVADIGGIGRLHLPLTTVPRL